MKTKRSLSERLAPFQSGTADSPLRAETVRSVFRGVGLVTGLPYPAQRLERLTVDWKLPEPFRYARAVDLAQFNMDQEECRAEGKELMAQLLIEPFAAIHEMLKEDEKNGHV